MEILYVVEKLGPYHIFRISEFAGHSITVLETRPDSKRYSWKEDLSDSGLTVLRLPLKGKKESIFDLLKQKSPDFLLLSGYGFVEMLWVMEWGLINNKGMCLLSDSTEFDEQRKALREALKSLLVQTFHAGIVAGARSKKYLQSLGMKSSAIFSPYDVIDNQFYSNSQNTSEPFTHEYFLCVSRLIPKKNLLFLVEAFAIYHQEDCLTHFYLLGDGEMEDAIKSKIKSLGLSDFIHIQGFLHGEEVKRYYQNAKALILASTSDQWGLCVNEGIAAGAPVICSTMAGASEDLIEDGISGFLFSPFKLEELVEKMKLINTMTVSQKTEMVNLAKKKLEYFSRENFHIAIYQAVISMKANLPNGKKDLFRLVKIATIQVASKLIRT